MAVYIPATGEQPSFAQSFARTAQAAATPAFELQFFATQNAVQDRMAADIEAILSNTVSTAGQTAHLDRKLKALKPKLEAAQTYETRVKHNRLAVNEAVALLAELKALTDPASVAEFDAKRAQILDALDNLRTAGGDTIGVPDGLRSAKNDGIAALNALVHNNFATQGDIDAAEATIDEITASLNTSLAFIDINADIAVNTANSLDTTIARTQFQIDEIEFAARDAQRDKVTEAQSYYGRILTNLSLSFEAALGLTAAISESTILSETPQTGTVLDFYV